MTLRTRSIIHLNVADFAVAVERTLDPRLRGRPAIVAPEGALRAAVYDMSEEAFQAGVRKGMALRTARRRCPDARIVPPRPDRYEQAMRSLLRESIAYSPLVESGPGDGHLFLDVTGTGRLFGPPVDVAWRLRRQIHADLALDPIWSVAPNKLVAKVASRIVKPTGEYIVQPGEEEAFLSPLPVHLLPGLERGDLLRLRDFNLDRVAQLTALHPEQLEILFDRRARDVYETVRGIDPSPVAPAGNEPPRVAAAHAFADDTNDPGALKAALYRLVERAGLELRTRRLAARRVGVVVDHSDGMRRARQQAVRPATANDLTLFETARRPLLLASARRVRVRHLRLICDRLTFPPAQRPLFAETGRETVRRENLVAAIDAVRSRFGRDALRMGRTMAA
ncbi:MAG: hypothetical protein LJE65_17490 [Desulfobacteraceae bacterium]|nr:hypothetical protein [Desulfobacteraceae bacterium]